MLNYIISRLLSAAIVIIGVVFIVFMLIHMVPGDPVEVMLGESATAVDRETLRKSLGLDQSIAQQFYQFLNGVMHFDLGNSLHSRKPIAELISARIGPTVQLTLASLLVAFLIAFMGWMPAPLDISIWHSVWTVEKKKLNPSISTKQSLFDFNVGFTPLKPIFN